MLRVPSPWTSLSSDKLWFYDSLLCFTSFCDIAVHVPNIKLAYFSDTFHLSLNKNYCLYSYIYLWFFLLRLSLCVNFLIINVFWFLFLIRWVYHFSCTWPYYRLSHEQDGNTPLHLACKGVVSYGNSPKCLKMLVDKGANLSISNKVYHYLFFRFRLRIRKLVICLNIQT